jgi:hypothetical protein
MLSHEQRVCRNTQALSFSLSITGVALILAAACGVPADGNGSIGPTNPNTRTPSGGASCGTSKAIFNVPPVALADFFGWVPLGNLNPPGHTFPTDHQYIYVNSPSSQAPRREVTLFAPGDLTITKAHQGTTTPGATDYTLEFSACAEVYGQFGHVLTIAPPILSRLGAFDQFCNSYSPAPGSSVSTCETKGLAIKVAAGEVMGTAGGSSPHSFGLDFSLWDARVQPLTYANPSHWQASSDKFDNFHVVPASDYFAEPTGSRIAVRIGSFDGTVRRTFAPIGGTIEVDVPGSAMGFWFNASQPTYPESAHLAIAPDNVDPSKISISIGTSLANWTRGLVTFTPTILGSVNRHPATITADGNTYCFEAPGAWVLLAKLLDANTLRLQAASQSVTTCAAAQPWTFTAAAFDYKR